MSTFPIKSIVGMFAVFLALSVGVVVARSRLKPSSGTKPPPGADYAEGSQVIGQRSPKLTPLDTINRIWVQFSDSQRFGLICPRLRDPRNPEKPKLLTRDERGLTNNTCVRIEGYEYLFGHTIPGVRWTRENGKFVKELPISGKDKDRAWRSSMDFEYSRVQCTQTVEIVVGEATRLYDTALVKYTLTNHDKVPHTVGLRVMLDTFIGAEDGVPFYIPPVYDGSGREMKPDRLVDKMEIFAQKDIPDFVQALETSNLNDPNGTVAIVGLKLRNVEPIEKMVICRWPQNSEARWGGTGAPGDWVYEPMNKNPNAKDSCIVLYWQQVTMKPGESRDLAFTYGLGRIAGEYEDSKNFNGRMRLMVGNRTQVGKPITLLAYVRSTDPGQTVTLRLPEGLTLLPGQTAEQAVPKPGPAGYSTVTWRAITSRPGDYQVEADAPNIGTAKKPFTVWADSIFGGGN